MFINTSKNIQLTRRIRTLQEVEQYFLRFLSFIDSTEQQIPRSAYKRRKKIFNSGKKERHTIKIQLMINNQYGLIHKTNYKKGKRHDCDIYYKNRPVILKQVITVFALGYLGIEKDYPEQLQH
jgi:Transposase DDE domain